MSINEALTKFEYYLLTERRVSHNTVAAYTQDVKQLRDFLLAENKRLLQEVNDDLVVLFLAHLKKSSAVSKNVSLARKVASLRAFFGFLKERYCITCLERPLLTPKLERSLPKALSEQDVISMLEALDRDERPLARRNRALLYVLYATAIRVSELTRLTMASIQHEGFLRVFGKGAKERMVPLIEPVAKMLEEYVRLTRPQLLEGGVFADQLFFTVARGEVRPMTRQQVWNIIKQLGVQLESEGKQVSPHVLRHSLATHLLKNGADLRSLQVLLGHEQLTTVQIYTKVETSYLRSMYDKKHLRS